MADYLLRKFIKKELTIFRNIEKTQNTLDDRSQTIIYARKGFTNIMIQMIANQY